MSTNLQSAEVPAGWYEDPEDGERLRWWSGEAWTTNVIDAATAGPADAPESAVPAEPSVQPEPAMPTQPVVPTGAAEVTAPAVPAETGVPIAPAGAAETAEPAVSDAPAEVFLSRRALREKLGPLVAQPVPVAKPIVEPEPEPEPEPAAEAEPLPEPTSDLGAPAKRDETVVAPAGWFDDPTGLDQNRWWNGSVWTEHTSPKNVAVARPPVPESANKPVANDGAHGYVSFGDHRSWQGHATRVAAAPVRWNTPGAVAMSFMPWIGLLSAVGLLALVVLDSGAWWWWIGASLLPLLFSIAFAVRDHKKLGALGYESLPGLGWLVLGPLAYLIARAVRVYPRVRNGSLPLWLFIVNSLLVSVVIVGATLTLGLDLAAQRVDGIERSIETGLRAGGHGYIVACPPSADAFMIGSTSSAPPPMRREWPERSRCGSRARTGFSPTGSRPVP